MLTINDYGKAITIVLAFVFSAMWSVSNDDLLEDEIKGIERVPDGPTLAESEERLLNYEVKGIQRRDDGPSLGDSEQRLLETLAASDSDDDPYSYSDKPQCFCCDRKLGMLMAATLPLAIPAIQFIFVQVLNATDTDSKGVLNGNLLEGFYSKLFFEAAVVAAGFGSSTLNIGASKSSSTVGPSAMSKRLVSLYLLGMVALTAIYIANGAFRGGWLGLSFFKTDISQRNESWMRPLKAGYNSYARSDSSTSEEAMFALRYGGYLIVDEVWTKMKDVLFTYAITRANWSISFIVILILNFKTVFTAFLFGYIPAGIVLVTVPFIYEQGLSMGLKWEIKRRGGMRS